MHNYCLLLLMWFPFMASEPFSCDLCMRITQAGNVVTGTLLVHIYYSCPSTVIWSCTHNHTVYSVCSHGNQHICFNPTYRPPRAMVRDQECLQSWEPYQPHQVFSPDKAVSLFFDACVAIDKGGCGGTGCGCGRLAWERSLHDMVSVCAGETTLGHGMMWVLIIVLIGVALHGPHGRELSTQPPSQRESCP
jgi:hypothetical protein